MFIYALTIFLSAFLLFQVQPLIAKFILPWFGGSAAVWSAALLFFQLLLLAGYFYAHCLIRYLKPKKQLTVHFTLLALSLLTLPIIPRAYWKPDGFGEPTFKILLLLAATIGLPYMLLSASSPLLQAWYVRKRHGAIPYRLFALSNFGSFLALLSYPFLIEPRLALSTQAYGWSGGFALFAVVCGLAGWSSKDGVDAPEAAAEETGEKPSMQTKVFWVALSACASSLLLATTSHLTQNVAPIPLLWVVPLSIYLLSFILCFESGRLYQRWVFMPLLVGSLWLFARGVTQFEDNEDVIKKLIPALCGALFVCCMVCHGELARRKPSPKYLTQFYLMVSVGGAIGGLFVALAAPHFFKSYLEMPIAVGVCALLAAFSLWEDTSGVGMAVCGLAAALGLWNYNIKGLPDNNTGMAMHMALCVILAFAVGYLCRGVQVRQALLLAATAAFAGYLGKQEVTNDGYYTTAERNFYGLLRVRDDPPMDNYPGERVLVHGTINHGTEIKAPNAGRIATSYFGVGSGISRAIRAKYDKGPIRIGILGLGAGVTATLARAGDTLHYYEINPLVPQLDQKYFSFFASCPADKSISLGDGRLVLDRIPSEQLDFLAMDAFSSDSVPIHLLTREAYQIYLRHLKPDGVLAVNISNRYLDLEPVVSQAAKEIGWTGVTVTDDGTLETYYTASTWMILSPKPEFFMHQNFQDPEVAPMASRNGIKPWTDDYSNIAQITNNLPDWLKAVLP
ncbi:MAG TPA: fused MFS/spermidine synthase [Bryobacteraceae bacterium]|jgi:hypothetical protein